MGYMRGLHAQPVEYRVKSRILFALYVLGPMFLVFFLPLPFFRSPLIVFLSEDRLVAVSAPFVRVAVAVCLVWFAVASGLVIWPSRRGRAAGPREWSPRALWGAFVGLSLVGSGVALIHSFRVLPAGIEEFAHVSSLAPSIGFVLGTYILRRGLARGLAALMWVLLVIDILVALLVPVLLSKVAPAALSTVAILYGLTVSGVSWRRQAAVALLLVPLVLVALSSKEYLRMRFYGSDSFHRGGQTRPPSVTSSTPPVALTFEERLAAFDPSKVALRFHRASGPLLLVQFGAWRILQRTERISDLAYIVEMTPATVPYAGGVTYVPLLSKLVPRFIWPNKPRETVGQFYGHRYAFLDPPDLVHSVNLPIVTEGWVNAGWTGVVLSAAAMGVALRLIWTLWIGPTGAPGNVLIGMAVVGTAADAESNFSLVVGGMLHALLVYVSLAAFISYWDRTSARTRTAGRASSGIIVDAPGR